MFELGISRVDRKLWVIPLRKLRSFFPSPPL
jgi:hypothetical protein